ncbi:ABC transporter substrate-binding protein [Microbacterium sp. zg.Y1090]|uniref:ABC transporter substrate-binding protein n=1 Tax=Microbacterium TaxID=33882 RepID=UPI00214BF694|nr:MULTISPECIES: ABC transporter substrate-binding protein [unclassified Microbacterium]MCR2813098.1 ABC transporter substrate-binding protein [Microbacterium sp. zg.Y1084]MCR2819412.1 ABC transporter substrate-binding protein [Microbacterium sp. zg.Y1090]MDL5487044.1 ABC transporter substrate-binding protein [Microbacterium sp. zg-Y1211]WIM28390.1 ABC transporter substrate-binding protein [Microbacterium sp. zg-Y1090]
MKTRALRRTTALLAGVATTAIVLAGCAGGGDAASNDGDGDATATLTLATFNDMGYSDELLAEFTEETGIKVVHNKAATSNDARANFFQKLGKGGLADVEAVEVDWFTEMMKYSDLVVPVPDDLKGRWLDWKEAAATDADGNLVAYGTDMGPQSICYRADLFEAAGLPTDRAEVAELFPTWDAFFQVGSEYVEKTGTPFIDSANSLLQGFVNQLELAYEEPDGTIIAAENPDIRAAYDQVIDNGLPISAFAGQWSDDWYAAMAGGEFAAMLCPPWMHGIIAGEAPEVEGWDIANAFPEGGGNWGGSYLVVPADGKNTEAAQKLADWLTAPENQIKAFENAGTFPSQVEAQDSDAVTSYTNEYFNGAPTGQIGIDRANAIEVSTYKGEKYFQYHDALQNAITRVFDGLEDKETAWNTWLTEISGF